MSFYGPWSFAEEGVEVDPSAFCQGHHRIGRYCKVGARATLKWGATLTAFTEIGDDTEMGPFSVCTGPGIPLNPTRIGKRCRIGGHVGIKPGVQICNDVTVAWGTWVPEDITEPGTWGNAEGSHAKMRRIK